MTLLPRPNLLPRFAVLRRLTLLIGSGVTGLFFAPIPASANTDAIAQALSGNTLSGRLDASGPFEEYYDSSGAIHGADYTGRWTLSGDRLCLGYDGNPPSCWQVQIEGDTLLWHGAGGILEGRARIIQGNPKGF